MLEIVGSEGKRRKKWDLKDKGKSPGRPYQEECSLPKGKIPWRPTCNTQEERSRDQHSKIWTRKTKRSTRTKKISTRSEGGRIGLKKGGSDKKWIQKAVNPKHKGYCTPMTKKTCTPARKALARTFKKKAKTGWG